MMHYTVLREDNFVELRLYIEIKYFRTSNQMLIGSLLLL